MNKFIRYDDTKWVSLDKIVSVWYMGEELRFETLLDTPDSYAVVQSGYVSDFREALGI